MVNFKYPNESIEIKDNWQQRRTSDFPANNHKSRSQDNKVLEQCQAKGYNHDKKRSLYDKLHDSLTTYIKDHKKEVTLQGTRRYTGKTGEYYLQTHQTNNDSITESDRDNTLSLCDSQSNFNTTTNNLSVLSNAINTKYNNPADKFVDVIKDTMILKELNMEPSLEKIQTSVINRKSKKSAVLTPIPAVHKKSIRNKVQKQDFSKAERTAVQIRRLEYSGSMTGNTTGKKLRLNTESLRIAKSVRIQRWWRSINYKLRYLVKVQSVFRGYMTRKKFYDLLTNANDLLTRLIEFEQYIQRPFQKRYFEYLYTRFARKAQFKKLTKVVLVIQKQIRQFLERLRSKRTTMTNTIVSIFNIRKRDTFGCVIRVMTQLGAAKCIQSFIKKYNNRRKRNKINIDSLSNIIQLVYLKENFHFFKKCLKYLSMQRKFRSLYSNLEEINNASKSKHFFNKYKLRVNQIVKKEQLGKQGILKISQTIAKHHMISLIDKLKLVKLRSRFLQGLIKEATKKNAFNTKYYFMRWVNKSEHISAKQRSNAQKHNLVNTKLKFIVKRLSNGILKSYYLKWNKYSIHTSKKLHNYRNIQMLVHAIKCFVYKSTFNKVLEAFMQKRDNLAVKTKLRSAVRNKTRLEYSSLTLYFNKWKMSLTNKIKEMITAKLMKKIVNKLDIKTYFNKWVKGIKETVNRRNRSRILSGFFDIANGMMKLHSCIKMLNEKKVFFQALSNIHLKKSQLDRAKVLLKNYHNIHQNLLKHYFNRLRKQKNTLKTARIKLRHIYQKYDFVLFNKLRYYFSFWKLLSKNNYIDSSKVKTIVNGIRSYVLRKHFESVTTSYFDKSRSSQRLKSINRFVTKKDNKMTSLMKKYFDRFLNKVNMKKTNQDVMEQFIGKLSNVRILTDLIRKIMLKKFDVLGAMKTHHHSNIFSSLIANVLSNRRYLKSSFDKLRRLSHFRKTTNVMLTRILKNLSKNAVLHDKLGHFNNWRYQTKMIHNSNMISNTKKLTTILSQVFQKPSLTALFKLQNLSKLKKKMIRIIGHSKTIALKYYFNIWNKSTSKGLMKQVKMKSIKKSLKAFIFSKQSKDLSLFFSLWCNNVKTVNKKAINLIECLKEVLLSRKSNFIDHLSTFSKDVEKRQLLKKLTHKFARLHKNVLKRYFNKWSKVYFQDKLNNYKKALKNKMIKSIYIDQRSKALKSSFSHWVKTTNFTKTNEYNHIIKSVQRLQNLLRHKHLGSIIKSIGIKNGQQLLKSMVQRLGIINRSQLRAYFSKLKLQTLKDGSLQNYKLKSTKKVINNLDEKYRFLRLIKYFGRFKRLLIFNTSLSNLMSSVMNGVILLKRFALKKYFNQFVSGSRISFPRIASNMNLHAQTALRMKRVNLAKLLYMRSIYMKSYFKHWKLAVKRDTYLNNVVTKLKVITNRIIAAYFNKWNKAALRHTSANMSKKYAAKTLKNFYLKSERDSIVKNFKKWKNMNSMLRKFQDVFGQILNRNKRRGFEMLVDNINENNTKKVTLMRSIRRSDKAGKKFVIKKFFDRWSKNWAYHRLLQVKNKFLKASILKINKKIYDESTILKNYFNRFLRNVSVLKPTKFSHMLEILSGPNKGLNSINKGLLKSPFSRFISGLKEKVKNKLLVKFLMSTLR